MIVNLTVKIDVDAVYWAKNHTQGSGEPIEFESDIPDSIAYAVEMKLVDQLEVNATVKVVKK